jgi:hypothetical protein
LPSFVVNPPAEPVELTDGTAKVAFTVTNTSERALDGTALVHVEPPTAPEWFAVAGEATRRYQPGGVEQVAVTITVPAGTAPGSYGFRLDAKSDENPDEDYTEGPGVAFEVPPPPPPKPVPWWRKYWWVIAIAAAVVIAIVVLVIVLTRGAEADIPERNCVEYDPASVTVDSFGIALFFINSNSGRLAGARTFPDAVRVQTLAKAHTKHCRIGTPPGRSVEYWLGDGGGPRPPRDDCIPYDPDALEIVDEGPGGFLLTDRRSRMEIVDTRQDADDLLAMARAFRSQCFIGRSRFGREFVITYWE